MYPNWKQDFATVNGIKIHYTRTGDGTKPPLVLAHGFSDNGMCWMPVARELENEYDVILPDARGHGLSERIDPNGVVDQPADLAGLISVLGLRGAVAGGHSMGGNSSSAMGARFPYAAKALILEDPGWRDRPPQPPAQEAPKEPPRNPWFEWLQSLPGLTVEEVMAKGRADSPTWPEDELPAWAESKKQLDLNVLGAKNEYMDWHEVIKAIQVPTLLLTADPEKGAIVTPEGAAEARQNPYIREVNIPGVGHNIRRENFPAFMAAVRLFLKEVA